MDFYKDPLKILIIDDDERVFEEITKRISILNYHIISYYLNPNKYLSSINHPHTIHEVDCMERVKSENEFIKTKFKPENYTFYSKVDIIFLDLELETEKVSKIMYRREDLAGGTIFLPYFRINFPWIPVICISRLFDHKESNYFSSVAGSYGFDGYLHKDSFYETVKESKTKGDDENTRGKTLQNNDLIDTKLFNTIINNAKEHRICYQTDYSFSKSNKQLEFAVPPPIEKSLDSKYNNWREFFKIVFFPFDKIVVKQISGGYSGASTYRIKLIKRKLDEQTESFWLLKISDNPCKLDKEVKSHYSFQQSGLPYARSVPMLWKGVVEAYNISCIVYKFAEGTNTLSNIISDYEVTKLNFVKLKSLFEVIYNKEKCLSQDSTIAQAVKILLEPNRIINDPIVIKAKLEILNLIEDIFFDELTKYTSCWIHGDLHTKNILIGERNVLIDFARACIGPLIYDISKLSCDLLYHFDECREKDILFLDKNTKLFNLISQSINLSTLTKEDKKLFGIFLIFELASCLYKEFDDEKQLKNFRKWIRKFLKSITINSKQLVIK